MSRAAGEDYDPHVALLSAAEEVELAKRIEAGLYAEHLLQRGGNVSETDLRIVAADGRTAFRQFVSANVRLAEWFARRRAAVRATGGLAVEDLKNEGVLGVIRGVQKFDFMQGYKFSTYASWWIRNHQQRAVVAQSPMALTARDRESCTELLSTREYLINKLDRLPTRAELATELGITVSAVAEREAMLRPAASLDAPVGADGELTLVDTIAAPSPVASVYSSIPLEPLLAGLAQRERAVLSEVFGLETGTAKPISAVAAAKQLPPVKVAALVESTLAKLRAAAIKRGVAA